ncbi:hypothetical protein [Brevundimonas sp.]|uniref:hypothetical protein n=1 Tax=Brevundimonas sp. TaxID=1871086 RepID=UPI003D6CA633
MTSTTKKGGERLSRFWRLGLWSLIAVLLLTPLIAMQFTREVAWDGADFAFAGVLLVGAGILFELAARATRSLAWRLAIGAVLLLAVLIIWADAAVGVF